MTTPFILKYIPVKMTDLGFGGRYRVRMQTLIVPANKVVTVKSYNIWTFFPLEDALDHSALSVESNFGYIDPNGTHTVQSSEHTGKITVNNGGATPLILTMIQAIPQGNKPTQKHPIILST